MEAIDGVSEPRGVLARYAAILETVASASSTLSLTEIMRGTGLSRGTTHRLINSLLDIGYLSRYGSQKAYHIGPRLIRLFHLAHSRASISALVRPTLQGIVSRFGETAFVARCSGDEVQSVAVVVPENYTQSHVHPGRYMPINAAASAKAIFAFQSEAAINKALSRPLQRYTSKTLVDAQALRQNLAEVRQQGYAICADELDPDVLSFACPIHLPHVGVLYSVGIVGLSRRLMPYDRSTIIGALKDAADVITSRLQGELKLVDGSQLQS